MRTGSGTSRRDRGGGSLYALAVGLVFALTGVSVAVQGSRLVTAAQAQSAADLGALAGAAHTIEGGPAACARAAAAAAANAATTVSCQVDGLDLLLVVRVAGRIGAVEATARAGPVRITAGDHSGPENEGPNPAAAPGGSEGAGGS